MAQRIPIQVHVANALQWLGTLYRNPADAIKEHVSNAIDEHLKAQLEGTALERCRVTFTLDKRQITIQYGYGMSRAEFESALRRVADSAKRTSARSIGRLGIGIFSFQQIGRKCTFYSRKTAASETLRVVLKEGSDEAFMETSLARDSLAQPGLRVVISELKFDPTRPRGPLAPEALRRYLGEKFEAYLREGWLRIEIVSGLAHFQVAPPRLQLPRLLADLKTVSLAGDRSKRVNLELYFDPSGKGRVAIRHAGVSIVENLAALSAYGIEESVYARGLVRGFIDAEFLTPLPSRTAFEENDDWLALLDLLDRYRPTLETEVETHLTMLRARQAADIEKRALRIARDILDLDEFRELTLPGGLAKRGRPMTSPPPEAGRARKRAQRDAAPKDPGDRVSPRGHRIRYEEVPFENGSRAHSRFIAGVVQANTLHPDYQQAASRADSRLAYAAVLIGKETIAFNDRSGSAGDFLEKLLDFWFKLQARTRRRGSRTVTIAAEGDQASLDLSS